MKGVLSVEEKHSVIDDDKRIFEWCIYIDGEGSPWIEDGTGYATKKLAFAVGRKWAKRIGIEIREENFYAPNLPTQQLLNKNNE